MTCQECRDKFTDLVENSLPPEVDAELRAHLESCAECRRLLAEFWGVVEAVRDLPTEEPPAALREQVRWAVQERAAERAQASRARRVRYAVGGLAAAAAAAVIVWAGMLYYGEEQFPSREQPPISVGPEPGEREPTAEEAVAEPGAEEAVPGEAAVPGEEVVAPAEEAEVAAVTAVAEREGPAPPTPTERAAVREERGGGVAEPAEAERAEAAGPPARMGRGAAPPSGMHRVRRTPTGGWVWDTEGAEEEADRAGEPKYFAVEAGTAARRVTAAGPTQVDIRVVPPTRRVVGEVVAATVVVTPDQDVASATVTVEDAGGLEIVGAPDSVIYRGPLTGGQRTELSVRLRAKRVGSYKLAIRLKSTAPALNTRVVSPIVGFRLPLSPAERLVTFKFTNTLIREALAKIAAASQMQVTISDEVDSQRIALDFSAGVPARVALVIVADAGGYQVREENGHFIVEKP